MRTLHDNPYILWNFTEAEQEELLGTDIGQHYPMIVVELDEVSQWSFYNRRFAPLTYHIVDWGDHVERFRISLFSIDDRTQKYTWITKEMQTPYYEAHTKLMEWLERTNYFINLAGFESFCLGIFGPECERDYN